MAVIILPSGNSWHKAGWVMRRFFSNVLATFPEDTQMASELEMAEAFSGLCLNLLDRDLAKRILLSLHAVAAATVRGESGVHVAGNDIGGEVLDEEDHKAYVESIRELLGKINQEPSFGPG